MKRSSAIVLPILLALSIVSACSTTPARSTIQWPEFQKIKPAPLITTQPGDEAVEQITVGEIRNAVAVAEAYDLLVPFFNETIDAANKVVEFGKSLEAENKQLIKDMRFQRVISAGVGAAALFGAGYAFANMTAK